MKYIENIKFKSSKYMLLCLVVLVGNANGQVNTCTQQTLSLNWKPNYRNHIDVLTKQEVRTNEIEISSSFENKPQYKQHVNTIFTTMRGWRNKKPISARQHLAIAVVITDSDGSIDNCNTKYQTLVAVKKNDGTADTRSYTAPPNQLLFRHAYAIGFYIGEAFTDFEYTLDQDTPAGEWGTELANNRSTVKLTSPAINAARGEFLVLDTYLQGQLRYLQITAK